MQIIPWLKSIGLILATLAIVFPLLDMIAGFWARVIIELFKL